jgi:hypothetical protein
MDPNIPEGSNAPVEFGDLPGLTASSPNTGAENHAKIGRFRATSNANAINSICWRRLFDSYRVLIAWICRILRILARFPVFRVRCAKCADCAAAKRPLIV